VNDIAINDDGDLVFAVPYVKDGKVQKNAYGRDIRDFALKREMNETRQMVYARLMTEKSDWYVYPSIGTVLTDLIGMPNSKETAQMGINTIMQALTYDNLFVPSQIDIKAVPVNPEEIVFLVRIQVTLTDVFSFYAILNVNKGVEIDVDYVG
jgi:hypothetical protein